MVAHLFSASCLGLLRPSSIKLQDSGISWRMRTHAYVKHAVGITRQRCQPTSARSPSVISSGITLLASLMPHLVFFADGVTAHHNTVNMG